MENRQKESSIVNGDQLHSIPYLKKGKSSLGIDWKRGVWLPIDKPVDWTSFDVVNKVRYVMKTLTGVKRFKVGHTGTLDPRATGLLLLACGKATKSIQAMSGANKTYTGVIQLGATTPSYDTEMEVDRRFPIDHITDEMVREAQHRFIGEIWQSPPLFSAIKKGGRRLYDYARKGEHVEVDARKVTVHHLVLDRKTGGQVAFTCTCSKGTYIRALARDIGATLKSGAYLRSLRRTAIDDLSIEDAWPLDLLIGELNQ